MDNLIIELSEIDAWLDLFAAQPSDFKEQQGADSVKIEGVSVFSCKKIPFPHFNVALDIGVRASFSEKTLDNILSYFKEKGIGKFYLQTTPVTQPDNAPEWFKARGLRHVSSWHRIARSNEAIGEALNITTNYTVEEVNASNAVEWADFIDRVYGMPTKSWLVQLVGRSGWHHVVGRESGKIIAARSMKINANASAYFCIDAPVPGVMTQNFEADYLLAKRLIEIGLKNEVTLFTSDIEKPSFEQNTPAYRYWAALGFEVAYEKKNFMF